MDGVQLRLCGRGAVHVEDDLARAHWGQTDAALRALYAAPDAPGSPLRQPDPRLMAVGRALDTEAEAQARANFAVIEVAVASVEWLQLRGGHQRRAVLHGSTGWVPQALAP